MEDAIFLSIIVVALVIMGYPIANTANSLNNNVQSDANINVQSKEKADDFLSSVPDILEGIYILLLFGGYLVSFILAFRIQNSPALFMFSVIAFTSASLVIPLLVNVWSAMNTTTYPLLSDGFTLIGFVLNNYLLITIVMWVSIGFALYAKRQVQ